MQTFLEGAAAFAGLLVFFLLLAAPIFVNAQAHAERDAKRKEQGRPRT